MLDLSVVDGISVRAAGEVPGGAREQVHRQVARFLARLPECWSDARIRLTRVNHRRPRWAALAQMNLDFKGQQVRAQVAAGFFAEAGRLLVARLEEQLARLAEPGTTLPWPSRQPRPEPVEVPVGQRRIVRTKRYPLVGCGVEQAALLMDLGDYDCYLFRDSEADQDAMVYRVGPTGYRLARVAGLAAAAPRTSMPVTVNVHPVPSCDAAEAARQLGETELPYRFFREADTGRGAVLYRRYDGHCALLGATLPASHG
ncbi:HPF/RaiA family ribosome-associated protein [Pseudonocardia eucalypti]|uniref:HPF/RaiA family ribosome-associated protein n=1 Tax=Pseudonocardia eucalypti TaxID=648755 RepID=A0ABP9QHX9_9PSEU